MATIGGTPKPNTPADARLRLDGELSDMVGNETIAEKGWARLDALTLLVPLVGRRASGELDPYLLRLGFGYYPDWPPSALFVNPATLRYEYPQDVPYLPRIVGSNEIAVHPNYEGVGQLICASVTLEFYLIKHGVEERHLWDASKQNFAATINAIDHWLKSPQYQGRFPRI